MKSESLKKYRTSFIIDMRAASETVDAVVTHLKGVLEGLGARVVDVKNLGQKAFSRVTQRSFPNGIYVQMAFEGESKADFNTQLKSKLKLDGRVHRIFTELVA